MNSVCYTLTWDDYDRHIAQLVQTVLLIRYQILIAAVFCRKCSEST